VPKLTQWHEAAGNPPLSGSHKMGWDTIKLVRDLANQFLDDVFEGDHPVGNS
jgi:hypothetical protein